ncbi:hypothetical protein GGF40_002086 [Coemansia sp. RSA 1286]|nr:hypothetical protein GGF39_002622 [Coemansia sp. RSA 1721]KAJ2637829.1 hypothetical protein GGF40_002086 [Coemansia sp. RSA 1286]
MASVNPETDKPDVIDNNNNNNNDSNTLPRKRHCTESDTEAAANDNDNDNGTDTDTDTDDSDNDTTAGQAGSLIDEDEMVRESLSLEVTWKGSEKYNLRIPKYATILSVKVLIEELTEIDADSQKLLGLVRGKLPKDNDTLVSLGVVDGTKIRLVGTRAADRFKGLHRCPLHPPPDNSDVTGISPDVDYPWDETQGGRRSQVVSRNWRAALDKIVESADIRLLNAPRPGKRLLVLDLDYTLFDCKNVSGNVADMARPGLHELLASVYPQYDLVVWSQTKWHVVESKITLLGMLTHPLYRITTALDISTMLTVKSVRGGQVMTHQVKPLEFIWARFPEQYNKENTVHVDDLSRNFALNYQNGLKIRQFKRADTKPRSDAELFKLTAYLLKIAELPSFDGLDHSQWRSYR